VQNRRELAGYRRRPSRRKARDVPRAAASRRKTVCAARVIGNLLCHGVVVKAEIDGHFGISFDDHFAGALERLRPSEEDGLIELRPGEIAATPLGRVFLRNLAMPFDAYLAEAPEKPVFSRTL
jgi:oxygen-independent coproporphyrinogen-3 oxidase